MDEEVMTPVEAAKFMRVHLRTLRRLAGDGRIPVHRLPGSNRLRFLKSELLASLDSGEVREVSAFASNDDTPL